MSSWREFIGNFSMEQGKDVIDWVAGDMFEQYGVYSDSIHITDQCTCFIARDGDAKVLIVSAGSEKDRFEGQEQMVDGKPVKICPMNNRNSHIIRDLFDYTNPTTDKKHDLSMGLGDRLGLASPGHIRLMKQHRLFPVLAQQSVRELNLTNRTFEDVLASAVWAVFQEGYQDGYGADGDHLKTSQEVKQALDFGYTMITLDCSEHINNSVEGMSGESMEYQYDNLEEKVRHRLEEKYLNQSFHLGNCITITISKAALMKMILMYQDVIRFIEEIYCDVIRPCGRDVDFEISIDETSDSTSPEFHYMIAREIIDRGVRFMSLAPRFCGEFQKGIDYKGDLEQFRRELKYHVAIAGYFDYKVSVHSGSDKFSAFPAIGELTGCKFHIKTAGTNWLEALGVIANADPQLFLSIYEFALEKLDDAKRYYHISTERSMAPEDKCIAEDPLRYIREDEAVRQILHITYGYILCQKDVNDRFVFRDRIYRILSQNEKLYYRALYEHINRHLVGLGINIF